MANMIRKVFRKKIGSILPRGSKTEHSKDDWPYIQSDTSRIGSPMPFARRTDIYSNPNAIAHFGFPFEAPKTLQMTTDTLEFMQRVTPASLSHLLIWYIYHDVVPYLNDPSSWYHVLNRAELVGWIRFGHELDHGLAINRVQQLPERLQAAILDLGLDEREVARKLTRLGNMKAMRDHELAEFKLNHVKHVASYTGAGEKLEASLRLVTSCRPISQTNWEGYRAKAISWIETFMEVVIRPAVDSSARAPSQWAIKATEKETRRAFERICERHSEEPPPAIYRQALNPFVQGHMTAPSVARESVTSHHEQSWFAGIGESYYAQTAASSSHDRAHRRRSAPMLDKGDSLLLSVSEKLDALQEEKVKLLQQQRSLLSGDANKALLQDGRTSRAFDREHPNMRNVAQQRYPPDSDSDYSEVADSYGPSVLNRYRPVGRSEQFVMRNFQASRSTPDLATMALLNGTTNGSHHNDHNLESTHLGEAQQRLPNAALPEGRCTPISGPSALRKPQNVDGNHRPGQVDNDDVSPNSIRWRTWYNGQQSRRSGVDFTKQSSGLVSQTYRPQPRKNDSIPENRNDSAFPGVFGDFSGVHCDPYAARPQRKSVAFNEQITSDNSMKANGRLLGLRTGTSTVPEKSKAGMVTAEETASYASGDDELTDQRIGHQQDGAVNGGHVNQDQDDEEEAMTSLSSQDSLVAAAAMARQASQSVERF